MSDGSGEQAPGESPADGSSADGSPANGLSEEARRRRRARVFGDVLPDRTGDERDDGGDGGDGGPDGAEEWLRRQVPPYHG